MCSVKQLLNDIEQCINNIIEKIKELDINTKGDIRQDISGIKTSLNTIRKKLGNICVVIIGETIK